MDSLNLWCWGRDSQGLALEVILDQEGLDQDGGESCLVSEVLGSVFHGEKNPWAGKWLTTFELLFLIGRMG